MMWRLLLRRCPTKSFTVVGDMAQATGAGGVGVLGGGARPLTSATRGPATT